MPYINSDARIQYAEFRKELKELFIHNSGELNYLLTLVIKRYHLTNPDNYQTLNDIVGALEGAKMEFSRRVIIPFEHQKLMTNGDV